MASKYLVRVLTSLLLGLVAVLGWAEPFGRFGFQAWPTVDYIDLKPDGFQVSDPLGDRFAFEGSMKDVRPKRVNWYEALYQGRDFAFSPAAVRVGGFQPGFQLYFPLGMRLRFTTTLSPFLTWGEGTVDMDNPTAKSRWVLLSFRNSQVPVLFVFDEPTQLVITGESGAWTLSTTERFKGWVRILTPFGKRKMGSTVESLGAAVKELKQFIEPILAPEPSLVSKEVREDEGGMTAIWTFDRPGAMIPRSLLLAKAGGYDLRLLTGVSRERLELESGPIQWSTEPRIAVKFPMVRVPVGRSLAVGDQMVHPPSTASAFDLPTLAELALANLTSVRDSEISDVIAQVREEYERSLNLVQVPDTQNWTPVGQDGIGLDLVAGHALLTETVIGNQGVNTIKNSAFWGVADRLDWSTWKVWMVNQDTARRAGALLAMAGALSQDPDRRLLGAMSQAGIAADRAMVTYSERRRFAPYLRVNIDPMVGLLRAAYSSPERKLVSDPYLESLLSEVRVLSPVRVLTQAVDGGYLVSWEHKANAPRNLTLLTGYPVEIEAKENLAGIKPSSTLGMTSLTFEPKGDGWCRVMLKLPKWAKPLPPSSPIPSYSE